MIEKKHRVLSFFLAVHILFAGAGVSIVDHFCFHKKTHEIGLFSTKSCCKTSKKEPTEGLVFKKSKCCEFTSIDIQKANFYSNVPVFKLLAPIVLFAFSETNFSFLFASIPLQQIVPMLKPRPPNIFLGVKWHVYIEQFLN